MPLTLQNNSLVSRSNKLGTGQGCCCDRPCPACNYPEFITFSFSNLQTTNLAPNWTAQEVSDLTDAVTDSLGSYQMELELATNSVIAYGLKTAANAESDGIYSSAGFSCSSGLLTSFFFSIAKPDFYNVLLPYFSGGGSPFFPGFGVVSFTSTPPAGLGGNVCSGFNRTLSSYYLDYEGRLSPGRTNLFQIDITLQA